LTHIKYFIEIGQVALNNEQENYYIHEANSSEISEVTKMLTQEATNVNLSVKLVNQSASTGLPPASLQSFLKERPDLPGMFITNHEKEFRNKYEILSSKILILMFILVNGALYHYDNFFQILQQYIR